MVIWENILKNYTAWSGWLFFVSALLGVVAYVILHNGSRAGAKVSKDETEKLIKETTKSVLESTSAEVQHAIDEIIIDNKDKSIKTVNEIISNTQESVQELENSLLKLNNLSNLIIEKSNYEKAFIYVIYYIDDLNDKPLNPRETEKLAQILSQYMISSRIGSLEYYVENEKFRFFGWEKELDVIISNYNSFCLLSNPIGGSPSLHFKYRLSLKKHGEENFKDEADLSKELILEINRGGIDSKSKHEFDEIFLEKLKQIEIGHSEGIFETYNKRIKYIAASDSKNIPFLDFPVDLKFNKVEN